MLDGVQKLSCGSLFLIHCNTITGTLHRFTESLTLVRRSEICQVTPGVTNYDLVPLGTLQLLPLRAGGERTPSETPAPCSPILCNAVFSSMKTGGHLLCAQSLKCFQDASDSTNPAFEQRRQEEQTRTNTSEGTNWVRTLWSQPLTSTAKTSLLELYSSSDELSNDSRKRAQTSTI